MKQSNTRQDTRQDQKKKTKQDEPKQDKIRNNTRYETIPDKKI